MLGIALAILATFGWGISAIFVRIGLQHMSTSVGTLVSLISGLILAALVTLLVQPAELLSPSWAAVVWFALAGTFNFPMGRFFNYLSVARLGVARSTPVLSTGPLFAVTVSVLLLGEQLTPLTALGTLFVVAGVYIAITEGEGPER